MNIEEAGLLLAKIAGYDNRTVGDANILAWQESLADVDLGDALAAVAVHFRTSDAYLMPVHVCRIAGDMARERHRIAREQRERLAIEAEAASRGPVRDRSAEVADMLAALRDRLGPSDPSVLRRAEWVREERIRQHDNTPNPHYQGPPPPGGWPLPAEETA